jgi:class 3 adenylate cyclase
MRAETAAGGILAFREEGRPWMAERRGCPGCGYENEEGQAFCGSCGARLLVKCDRCGIAIPPSFNFCGNCGAPLARPTGSEAGVEERRVVTVMFADLAGFTSRAERLDPEDVRAILTPYYATLREQVEAFGGVVEKFIGDAVVGVFGAPVAHGDDPERAVRAALEIVERVSAREPGGSAAALPIRIGINTGEAIVALDARSRVGEGMVAGDVVNTAARLQASAPTNAILVGHETYRCTSSTIDYEPLPPLDVKGKDRPVSAWRVRGALRAPGERPASDLPMVGRERELDTLTGLWQRTVTDRRPQLVTILGLPGVGKSRLVAEFTAAVRTRGGRVVVGRSLPYGESSAYDAFAQQIKHVADVPGGDAPGVAVEKLRRTMRALFDNDTGDEISTHLALMLGLPTESPAVDAGVRDRGVLFSSARRAVQALADMQPTMLVFEDVHWADSSLLDLIESFAAHVDTAALMMLAAARPELTARRPGWGGGRSASVSLVLEPLQQEHARELAVRLLARSAERQLRQTADAIAEAGEGNPLFIEELAASVAERSAQAAGELPSSIRGIIAARLDAIPQPERSVLLDASVVGRVFWDGALAGLTAQPGRLPELLRSLEGRDLVRRELASRFRGHEQFQFKHALIRDVAYAALPRARRRAAHAAVAAFLESVHADADTPAALGHHWLQAGDRERAVRYLVAAADQASRGWAKEEAVAIYRQALALVPEDDVRQRRVLRLKLAVALQMVFHIADAEGMAPLTEADSPGR